VTVLAWTRTLTGPDGWPIAVRGFSPAGVPKAVIQVLHGLAEHGDRYARFAGSAVAAGLAVIVHDHRGHGDSVRTEADRGHFGDEGGWASALDDVDRVAALARETWPGVPLVLLGHSMGSTIALHVLVRRSKGYAAALLSGPTGVVGPLRRFGLLATRAERWRLGKLGRSQLLHALSFGDFNKAFRPNRTEYDWLSRDPVEVDKYAHDPRCGFVVTTQHWYEHLLALGALEDARWLGAIRSDLPMYVFAGADDPASQQTRRIPPLVANLRAGGLRDVSVRVWSGARHELLNETNRDEVTADVLGWIDAHLPR
jgi:alpha-beta hydrolase superfamily lysophospholipase